MSKFRIPEKDAELVKQLVEIPRDRSNEFFRQLSGVPKGLYQLQGLIQAASPFARENGLDPNKLASLAQALNMARERASNMSDSEFVDEVVSQIGEANHSEEQGAALESIVVNLLSLENIRISTKATLLAYERHKCLTDCEILSSFTPVFDSRSVVQGAFVSLTLKVEFGEDEFNKSLYFAMDESDLDELEIAIANARRQAAALRELAKASGIDLLESAE